MFRGLMGWLWRVIDDDQNLVREGEVVLSYVCVCICTWCSDHSFDLWLVLALCGEMWSYELHWNGLDMVWLWLCTSGVQCLVWIALDVLNCDNWLCTSGVLCWLTLCKKLLAMLCTRWCAYVDLDCTRCAWLWCTSGVQCLDMDCTRRAWLWCTSGVPCFFRLH